MKTKKKVSRSVIFVFCLERKPKILNLLSGSLSSRAKFWKCLLFLSSQNNQDTPWIATFQISLTCEEGQKPFQSTTKSLNCLAMPMKPLLSLVIYSRYMLLLYNELEYDQPIYNSGHACGDRRRWGFFFCTLCKTFNLAQNICQTKALTLEEARDFHTSM